MELSEILGGAPAPDETASTVEPAPAPEPAPEPAEEAAPEPATTAEAPAEKPRDEQGRFVKAEPREEQSHTVPVAALLEERRKRQQYEARLREMEQKPKSEITDDEVWQSPTKALKQIAGDETRALQSEVQRLKYELSEDMVRSLHEDYDSVRDQFAQRAEAQDPAVFPILVAMGQQPNPARYVYEQYKRLQQFEEFSKHGSLDALRERIRLEERARLEAERRQPAPAQEVPRSLNSEPSAHTSSTPGEFEPTPMTNLFDRPF